MDWVGTRASPYALHPGLTNLSPIRIPMGAFGVLTCRFENRFSFVRPLHLLAFLTTLALLEHDDLCFRLLVAATLATCSLTLFPWDLSAMNFLNALPFPIQLSVISTLVPNSPLRKLM